VKEPRAAVAQEQVEAAGAHRGLAIDVTVLVGPGAVQRAVATLESLGFTATDSLWIGNDLVVVLDRAA
jgi:hypothetical protein